MIRSTMVYLWSTLFSKATPFLLLPVLTYFLSPSEFGLLAITQVTFQFAQSVFGLSLNINVARLFFRQPKSEFSVTLYYMGRILVVSALTSLVIVVIYSSMADTFFGVPSEWLYLIPLMAFFQMCGLTALSILRMEQKHWTYFGFEVASGIFNIVLTLLLVAALKFNWEGRILALVGATAATGVMSLVYIYRSGYIRIQHGAGHTATLLGVSLPLIPHSIAGVVLTASDRFFLEQMISTEAVGIYSVAYSFGMVVMIFSDSFAKAWSPWFYKMLEENSFSSKSKVVAGTYLYVLVLGAITVVYIFAANLILPLLLPSAYDRAVEYVGWICLGYLFFGVYQVFFHYLVYANLTKVIGLATAMAAVINLIANYFLISLYGPVGAALATTLAYFTSAVLVVAMAAGSVKMPWAQGLHFAVSGFMRQSGQRATNVGSPK